MSRPVEVRTKLGREPSPSGDSIDSQSAKTAHGGAEVGVDGGKHVRGRKRHIVTDTLGLLLIVVITAANADDGTTAPRLLAGLPAVTFPRLAVVWADTKYRNRALDGWLAGQSRLRLEVTSKPEGAEGFVPLKKRNWRRLSCAMTGPCRGAWPTLRCDLVGVARYSQWGQVQNGRA